MSELKIRRAEPEDAKEISEVSTETFWSTYGGNDNADQDDIRAYMAKAYAVDLLEEELRSERISFLLASVNDETAGYARLVVGSEAEGLEAERPMEISRIYLLPKFHGGGHGKTLMNACLDVARQNGCDAVWLSVWQHNEKAIGFYKKMGFREAGIAYFDLAGTIHEDLMMALSL